jgi:protein N-terminal asparagine amidohydrolase
MVDLDANTVAADIEWIPSSLRLPALDEPQAASTYLSLPAPLLLDSHFDQQSSIIRANYKSDVHQERLSQLDHYLASIQPLAMSAHRVLRSKDGESRQLHRLITHNNSGRVINVLQGEIAHCTSLQADILVSDDATTCHIVALWSRGQDCNLGTLTHIDGPGYGPCIKDAVKEHIKYHSDVTLRKKNTRTNTIHILIHIMGGFNDSDGSSIGITSSILDTLADISSLYNDRQEPQVCMTLETCAVASANDDGTGCPIGRGMALEVCTGKVFLAEVEDVAIDDKAICNNTIFNSVQGPAITLRSTRLWAAAYHSHKSEQERKLSVIHRPDSEFLWIEPFFFGYHPNAKALLEHNDANLLQITSTSPAAEKPNFIRKVRESLTYMNRNRSQIVFQHGCSMKFSRQGANNWIGNHTLSSDG